MQKQWVGKETLDMIYRSQQSVNLKYIPERLKIEDAIVSQSIEILEDYAQEKAIIAEADMPYMEQTAKSLLRILRGDAYRKIFEIYQKLNKDMAKFKENKAMLKNFENVVSILNNKRQAREMSMENLLQAKETLEADTGHSFKQKQRSMQQLQSYALIKYGEMKQKCDMNFEPYKNFVTSFNLSHQVKTTPTVKMAKKEKTIASQHNKKNKLALWVDKGKTTILKGIYKVKDAITDFYYRFEPYIAIGAIAMTGIVGWKLAKNVSDEANQFNEKTQQFAPSAMKKYYQEKNIDFAAAKAEQEKQKAESENYVKVQGKTIIEKDYYDTSLQIHLGSKESVQKLYDKIDFLAQSGKIKFAEGLDTKRYAHAFTMYNLIRPNSAENKAIQNLLNGGQENPDLINRLVMKAKAKGEGIKPDNNSIKTSNFDKAGKSLQIQHLKNLQKQR